MSTTSPTSNHPLSPFDEARLWAFFVEQNREAQRLVQGPAWRRVAVPSPGGGFHLETRPVDPASRTPHR